MPAYHSGRDDGYMAATINSRYVLRISSKDRYALEEILYDLRLLQRLAAKGAGVAIPAA
ncbi:MAG: hypothetical protein M3014_12790 [Chloroflexota bacterium]|nr:hypothetical protein [Chloroflexota bacterium]